MKQQIQTETSNKQCLTEKELTAIEDQLGQEQILVEKYKMYAQNCNDPELKTKCEQIACKHQEHFDTLFKTLN